MVFLGYKPCGSWLSALLEHQEHQEHREHHFLMVTLPTPRKGLMPAARQATRIPKLASEPGLAPRPTIYPHISAIYPTANSLAFKPPQRYLPPVAANSAAGFGDPNEKAHRRPQPRLQALFLRPQFRVMAAVRGRPSGLPSSFSSVRQPAYSCHPNRLATVRAVLQSKRKACMHTSNLFRIPAFVPHRRF